MVHKLNVDLDYRLVKQKRKSYALERNQVAVKEVEKLLQNAFIREVYYLDWLSKVVMVKKSNGKWRMCIDFTNLAISTRPIRKIAFPCPESTCS
jgi:hypothetical protein